MSKIDDFLEEALRKRAPTELEDLLEFYVLCARARGDSEKTIEQTRTVLNLLKGYLEKQGLSTNALQIGSLELRGFIRDLQQRPKFASHPYAKPQANTLSPHTVNSYLRALRAAWNGWVAEGLLETSPFSKTMIPKVPKKAIPTFSGEQLANFFDAIDTSTTEGFRDYTLFLTYLDTLARLSEITGLEMSNLDLNGHIAKVSGKGGKERLVVFGVRVQRCLWRYIKQFRPEPALPKYDLVFLTRDGYPLTKNRVEQAMKGYGRKANIVGVRCSPHTLRHTGCLLWLRRGGDIFTLQRLTGHSSLEVLKGYLNLAQLDIVVGHQRYSPIDNLGIRMPRFKR
jgi:integrase/recombinase XerD